MVVIIVKNTKSSKTKSKTAHFIFANFMTSLMTMNTWIVQNELYMLYRVGF